MRVLHAEAAGLGVHLFGKLLLAAGHGFGQDDGGVVAGLDDQAVQQFIDGGGTARVDEHARAGRLVGAVGYRRPGVGLEGAVAQGLEHHVGGHQLGQRRRLDALVGGLAVEHRVGGDIEQEPRTGGDVGRRHTGALGNGWARQGGQSQAGAQQQGRQGTAQHGAG